MMFYLMFFHPSLKKWMTGMEANNFDWLFEYAEDYHYTLKVAMKIVNESNDTLVNFESLNMKGRFEWLTNKFALLNQIIKPYLEVSKNIS